MSTPSNIRCPSCHGPLTLVQMRCETCDLNLSGQFTQNEFAALPAEDLHFLRIFVHCEGRIRDMESALGVSYPTIKARLAKLKETLAVGADAQAAPQPGDTPGEVIRDLEAGRMTFEQAMARLKDMPREHSHEE